MKEFKKQFYKKNIQLIIMFMPIVLWLITILLLVGFSLPYGVYSVLNMLYLILLCSTTLFANAFIEVTLDDMFTIEMIIFKKANTKELLTHFFYGIPFVVFTLLFSIGGLITYLLLQILCMAIDKDHCTIVEKIIKLTSNSFEKKKEKKIDKVEIEYH